MSLKSLARPVILPVYGYDTHGYQMLKSDLKGEKFKETE